MLGKDRLSYISTQLMFLTQFQAIAGSGLTTLVVKNLELNQRCSVPSER